MRHPVLRPVLALIVAILVPACGESGDTFILPSTTGPSSGTLLAVTINNVLINVSSSQPAVILSAVGLTGLGGGENIVGIDYRPATGELFGISTLSRMYQIFPTTGACVQIGPIGGFTLSGGAFGVDFNPTVDRIRVVSDLDQNLRLNPTSGVLAATDTSLAYAAGDPNSGMNPEIFASAYSNNVAGAVVTNLYAIDMALDILVLQNPPNNGTLNTVGALGVDVMDISCFDIHSSGVAYAALPVAGVTGLYTINLTTGAATLVGTLGTGALTRGMTVVP